MRLLDLYCCAGGAATGYVRAGFTVVGVDIAPQPHYPYPFVQADALEYLEQHGSEFDAIHASPPCQSYSPHVSSRSSKWVPTLGKDEPALIASTRALLLGAGLPFIIENVMGARSEMVEPAQFCGSMFGLDIPRHRLIETNWPLTALEHQACRGIAKAAAERRGWDYRDMTVTGKGRRAGTSDRWRELLGIDWETSQHELAEAIPPAYTKYIGEQLMVLLHA